MKTSKWVRLFVFFGQDESSVANGICHTKYISNTEKKQQRERKRERMKTVGQKTLIESLPFHLTLCISSVHQRDEHVRRDVDGPKRNYMCCRNFCVHYGFISVILRLWLRSLSKTDETVYCKYTLDSIMNTASLPHAKCYVSLFWWWKWWCILSSLAECKNVCIRLTLHH